MKILLVHNYYQRPGGEDGVFLAEGRLLEKHGETVVPYTAHNDHVSQLGRLTLARATVWNRDTYRDVRTVLRREQPDVMHVHNTLPLISPAVFYAAKAEGVPVVQTLHNYRLLCLNATFYRHGAVCEDCVGKSFPYPGVMNRCYRGSWAASGTVATTVAVHRALRTWTKQVDLFIALTEFARSKFVEGGIPSDMLTVKPNFVDPAPAVGTGDGAYALFIGRLTPEKGIRTLLHAWTRETPALPLRIVGDGPLAAEVAVAAANSHEIEWLGHQPGPTVARLLSRATVLICPSEWYEGFPLVVVESLAAGLPVITSRIGSLASIIEDGVTGLYFPPGDSTALAERVAWASTHPDEWARIRARARQEYELRYTAERNYDMLMQAYGRATSRAGARLQ